MTSEVSGACQRQYIDQGVQTASDLESTKCHRSMPPQPNSTARYSSELVNNDQTPGYITLPTSPVERDVDSGAYNHSLASRRANSGKNVIASSGVNHLPKMRPRYRQIDYRRPSETMFSDARTVSLPESEPFELNIVNESLRAVSMPEYSTRSSAISDSSHLGKFETSGSSDLCSSADHGTAFQPFREHNCLQTPSPPSSPESVLIIGNNSQVPGSLLGQKHRTSEVPNSSPKPIPALHGPLSLPYARCPSGAEGTVNEGDDISNMIWGLGIDDHAATHSRPHQPIITILKHASSSVLPPRFSQVQDCGPCHVNTEQLRTHEMIDITGLKTVPEILVKKRNADSHFVGYGALGSESLREAASLGSGEHLWGNCKSPRNNTRRMGTRADHLGLGLNFIDSPLENASRDQMGSISSNDSFSSRLSSLQSDHTAQKYPRIIIEPRSHNAQIIQATRGLPALDIAKRYRASQQLQSILPTPPSSSSPQWSPCFSHYSDYDHSEISMPQSRVQKIISSQKLIHQLRSRALNTETFTAGLQQPFNNEFGVPEIPTSFMAQQHQEIPLHTTSPAVRNVKLSLLIGSPEQPSPPPNTPNFPSFSAKSLSNALAHRSPYNGMPVQSDPGPPDSRRNLSDQQTRSIPLARLIQRRLSAVSEEDMVTDEPLRNLINLQGATSAITGKQFINTVQIPVSHSIAGHTKGIRDGDMAAFCPLTQTENEFGMTIRTSSHLAVPELAQAIVRLPSNFSHPSNTKLETETRSKAVKAVSKRKQQISSKLS